MRDLVVSYFPAERRTNSSVVSLVSILESFLDAENLSERLDALIALREWANGDYGTRMETLTGLLESRDELRVRFQSGARQILAEIHSVELFAEAGLHPREGFWSEAARRLVESVLPSAREETDLAYFLFRLYPTSKSIERLVALPEEMFERITRVIAPVDDAGAWAKQREDLIQAFHLLAVHVAGIGLSPGLRSRSHEGKIEESPFYQLQQASIELVRLNGEEPELRNWRGWVERCRKEMEYVRRRMEDTGVSTTLVFDMGTVERAMARMESIADLLYVVEPGQSIAAVKRLLEDVLKARRADMSLRALFRENSALIARKVVERTGKAGENYIANSRSEYRRMWKASLGGGLLTVLTAAIKLRLGEMHFAPFIEGIAVGTNYAVSFLIMQHFHLALATKQPSVTAATFAGIVRDNRGQARLEKVAEFTSRISRSQLASAAGNLLAVGVGSVVFAAVWAFVFHRPYLAVPRAEYVYKGLDPLASGTVFYAAVTGVVLWVSALAGGWFENFATFHQVPKAIAQHPLGRWFGQKRMQRVASIVDANISSWTTSIVLGYLLGFVPVVGAFFGIPLEVRHVTLNTGTLALAAASSGREWLYRGWFLGTLLGIAVTFVMNLGVSFSIAASVALKAYGVSSRERFRLMRYTVMNFLQSPRRFLVPSDKDWAQEAVEERHKSAAAAG